MKTSPSNNILRFNLGSQPGYEGRWRNKNTVPLIKNEFGKEAVDVECLLMRNKKAEKMIADGFSEPYDPEEHKPFTFKVQNS
jgi:hypothetical protein